MRKKSEDYEMKLRAKRIMEKFESSGKAVEDFMREQAHELMLKQELRKLREEDMRKQSERQKRLQLIHKLKVLENEKNSDSRVREVRDRDQALIQIRYQSSIKNHLEKEEVTRSLSKWAHSGFQTSRAQLQTVGSQSPLHGSSSVAEFQMQLIKQQQSKKAAEKKEGEGGK